jgi:integrase
MGAKINFTKAALDTLPLPQAGKRATYSDAKAPGLQLRVSCSGAKTFCVFRRVKHGNPERVTLGRYPQLSIERARAIAGEVAVEIAKGGNPGDVRRALKGELTFGELFDAYLERHAKPHKLSWDSDERNYRLYWAKPLGARKLSEIERSRIAEIHSTMTRGGHHSHANRVLALVSGVFSWGISAGLCEQNPARGIKRNTEKSRDRFLLPAELPRFFRALALETNETLRDYVLISLLTGARRGNVLAMRWPDVSLDRGEWRIPMTKNGTPQTVTLSPEAVEVLRSRLPEKPAEFVFPGTGKCGHFGWCYKSWGRFIRRIELLHLLELIGAERHWTTDEAEQALRAARENEASAIERCREELRKLDIDPDLARVPNLRPHDLRRTLGSYQAINGASLTIIGRSLNHKNVATTAIYARLNLDPVRESVNRASSSILTLAGLKSPTQIHQFPRAA